VVKTLTQEKPKLKIDWCSYDAALYACKNWHYSKSLPIGKTIKVGAWEDKKFIGCVLFSRGANGNIGSPYDLDQTQVCELTRIALNKHVAPVSQIMAIAFKFLKKISPGIQLIVSYADSGRGHHGGIYQATNWIYEGLKENELHIEMNGKMYHKRTIFAKYKMIVIEKLPCAKWVKVPGKHKYLMPLNKKLRKKILKLSRPYPKKVNNEI